MGGTAIPSINALFYTKKGKRERMNKYIDTSKIRLTAVGKVDDNGDILVSVRDVKRAIEQTPAADVVPKSELRKLQGENRIANREIKNLEHDVEVYREEFKNIRAEVAREIFEEIVQAIEKGVAEANKKVDITAVTLDIKRISSCVGKMYAGYIGMSICQVFKKYTGEQE